MEKGFNDDELADIMNEIESLEKEFSNDGEEKQMKNVETRSGEIEEHAESKEDESGASEVEEVQAMEKKEIVEDDVVDHEMEDVLEELSHMPIEQVVPVSKSENSHLQSEEREENIHHLQERPQMSEKNHSNNQTAMSFHVEGDIKFELSFHISGKFVGMTVTEEGLEIGLDGGAKFTVPIEHAGSCKKAS